ncbi:alpha/beta hydrolase [Streptomyces sp. NBC_00237]|uniref:alpha/beta hydrolase family protein n=1 Tax=Streptomyces sp. NBC_00237 TaxID=2975687 RepID=UPI0022556D4D|nr:alpha/beta hydrolase [Streptomyces sp. NBC_00237]MCX5207044.1 alpha/beta hydrolase [Streptomyces sp. NBC_00237]
MRRRTFLTSAAATATAFTALGAGFGTSPASAAPAPLELPRPTGPHPIGLATLHLRDESRADPWVPDERRELMVSLWYPARSASATSAAYLTAAESTTYLASAGFDLPPRLLSTVRTHASVGARAERTRGGLPLVILSPGLGMPRATLSVVAEELASRGYAVAGIGHNYEADGITFPDGHTTAGKVPDRSHFPRLGLGRAADVSFALDQLLSGHGQLPCGVRIDAGRIAMAGHSAGGFSTLPAMLRDRRIRAGLNIDGNFHVPNDVPLDRPYLMLGIPSHVPGGPDPTWDATWPELTGWRRWLSVEGVGHLSFTDVAPLGKQLGIPFQDLDGGRVAALTRAYVAAFADTHLRGRPAALLEGPSPLYPEVRFHRPGP